MGPKNRYPLRRTLGRNAVSWTAAALSPWPRLDYPEPGYSIMLGVPWDLRHLLPVNLRFIDRCDLDGLVDLHVVFDRRRREGMDELAEEMRRRFPDLPLRFHHYRPLPGAVVEKAHVSTFYNSLNCVTALAACRTRTMVLHDFDLYPLRPDYFREIAAALDRACVRFAGVERTNFDGLRDEDEIFGTWALAMDAQWLRNRRRPREIFHRVARVGGSGGRTVSLDPFSWLQLKTSRGPVSAFGPEAWCHVQNLCSAYLRFIGGQTVDIAWRLHNLWYLEELSGHPENLERAHGQMLAAAARGDRTIAVAGRTIDFDGVHPTCADKLRKEVTRMERALHGRTRPEIARYLDAADAFFGYVRQQSHAEAA